MDTDKLGQVIYEKALACGFDDCGIIPIDDMDGFQQRLQEREEKVPSSAFFYQGMGDFANIKKRFPWAKSVIIGTYWLGKYRFPPSLQGKYGKAFFLSPSNSVCKESLTARRDFETWFKEQGIRCEGGDQFGHPSIGPLRYAAMMAGLGIIRKNNFFYTKKGSFVELVGYVIDQKAWCHHVPDIRPCAESCHLCQTHCPSGALKGPFTMSPLECVSFITTFAKGELTPGLNDKNCSTWICGCDSCQDACPYNRQHDWNQGDAYPGLEELAPQLQPEKLLAQSDTFIQEKVIPYTDYHIAVDEAKTLKRCAARSLDNQM
ncbi:epoxyqueuosine reductase [Megasphaera elsdenii]|uniref:Epoxyqueuosine reductase n=1 Tax=Megasphaera elsdenii TaxID=907 RepID=A0A848ERR7_MEGEL|nr:epoxyqueuosine reductase [Megasphaera elsdenii]NMK38180.1 epoxyqueuosine reductase [Megasphaera elsdenii]